MKQIATISTILVGGIVFGMIVLGACFLVNGQRAAQAEPDPTVVLGIDVDPTGNTATSLGTIDQCISVDSGASFDIDVFLNSIPSPHNLGGFEYYLNYDNTKLQVNAIDHGPGVSLMMSQPRSGLLEGGDCSPPGSPCPDTDGSLFVSVVDTGGQGSAEGPGELGVLGRYSLSVIGGEGSTTMLTLADLALGGFEPAVTPWQDEIDQVWDGNFTPPYGLIAIDTSCPELTPAPAPTPEAPTTTVTATATPVVPTPTEEGGSSAGPGDMPWIAVYAAVGAVAVLVVGALALARLRSR